MQKTSLNTVNNENAIKALHLTEILKEIRTCAEVLINAIESASKLNTELRPPQELIN